MKSKRSLELNKIETNQKRRPTKGFVQLGHDVAAIIISAYPSFGFGGRNSVGH
jgi:hypothetical protein